MKCKAKKAFFAGKNDIYHRWKEVKNLNGKSKNQYYIPCERIVRA